MAISCSASYTTSDPHHRHTRIKMERQHSDDDYRSRPTSVGPAIPIATVMTANENWRGKNDPAERRRIQNRLNQRAFRQRQRAGESPKQYKPRSGSSRSDTRQQDESDDEDDNDDDDDEEEEDDDDDESTSSESSSQAASIAAGPSTQQSSAPERSSSAANAQTGRHWDELARIINRNFLSAAVTNAQHLGIDLAALQAGTSIKAPRITHRQVPQTLTPIELQHQVSHDPIIDIIPHARLRFNILRGIATGQVDAAEFSRCLRASGSCELVNGSWQRGGLVVWTDPEQVASWELSEVFVRRWYVLLQGCEDLLAATNAWRSKRGERLFPLQFNGGQAGSSSRS